MSPLTSILLIMCLVPPAAADGASCKPQNETVYLRKKGCPHCYSVITSICSGFCSTEDPVPKMPSHKAYQNVCTYKDFHYAKLKLPGCLPGVDPVVSYPVATECHCGHCTMDNSDCTFPVRDYRTQPDSCLSYDPFYY